MTLNGFEQSILAVLRDRGIEVYPQWGVGEYAIDFALAHPDQPGRMVLAVEADGDRYHRTYSTRDRDRLRQAHLENLGWRFHRVWSTTWFRDPAGEADRIIAAWQTAVTAVDEGHPVVPRTTLIEPTPDEPAPVAARGPRPRLDRRGQITDYQHAELVRLFRWLLGDGLLLDHEERIAQAMAELGFQRLGPRIREALTKALLSAQAELKRGGL
jgi:very-short-patch-repair endonuclease